MKMKFDILIILAAILNCGCAEKIISKPAIESILLIGSDRDPKETKTSIEEYPYLVSLALDYGRHFCTGTIVGSKWVLTAGHCVAKFENFIIQYNSTFRNMADAVEIEKTWKHPRFKFVHIDRNESIEDSIYDIALVRVKQDFANIRPAKLPKKGEELSPGSTATIVGWGMVRHGNKYVGLGSSNVLRKVDIKIRSPPEDPFCQSWDKNLICSARSSETNEFGDSGGPLIKNDVVWGVTSGYDHREEIPYRTSWFTYVPRYLEWVNCIMAQESDWSPCDYLYDPNFPW